MPRHDRARWPSASIDGSFRLPRWREFMSSIDLAPYSVAKSGIIGADPLDGAGTGRLRNYRVTAAGFASARSIPRKNSARSSDILVLANATFGQEKPIARVTRRGEQRCAGGSLHIYVPAHPGMPESIVWRELRGWRVLLAGCGSLERTIIQWGNSLLGRENTGNFVNSSS
jgi:hypothetical protein